MFKPKVRNCTEQRVGKWFVWRGNTNQNPTGPDAVGIDPVDLTADHGGVPGLDTFTVERFLGRLPTSIGLWLFSLFPLLIV
jgi:hypothetical protein